MEIWKRITNYENLYEISTTGRIRSLDRVTKTEKGQRCYKGKLLKQSIMPSGHLIVSLSKNGKTTHYLVHRLVAETFIPNPQNLDEVHHIDHNPQNNKVENLQWLSKEKHFTIHFEEIIKKSVDKNKRSINVFDLEDKFKRTFSSIIDAVQWLRNSGLPNAAAPNIVSACQGKYKTAYGFKWHYLK